MQRQNSKYVTDWKIITDTIAVIIAEIIGRQLKRQNSRYDVEGEGTMVNEVRALAQAEVCR